MTDLRGNVFLCVLDSVVTTQCATLPIIIQYVPANLASKAMLMLDAALSLFLTILAFHLHVDLRPYVNLTMETQFAPVQEERLEIHLSDVSLMEPSAEEINVDLIQDVE